MGETTSMGDDERVLVRRRIASIIDHPSVYMGGPSRRALGLAEAIITSLEIGQRLVTTSCDHRGWTTWKMHGAYCPHCGTRIHEAAPTNG